MRLEIENISLSGNELEFSVKIFRQLWLQNLISIFNFCRSQIEVFLISRLSILLFTFSQIFLASRNRRSPFFRSWKFWVEKIFSFAFHFLWDLRSEIFSFAFHFLEDFLFYVFIDLACLKFASKVKIEKKSDFWDSNSTYFLNLNISFFWKFTFEEIL